MTAEQKRKEIQNKGEENDRNMREQDTKNRTKDQKRELVKK